MKNLKKIIFSLIVGLLMSFSMSSCMDHDFPYTPEQYVQDMYAKAFVRVFGNPDPNQTWGFSSTTRSAVVTRAAKTWTDNHSCNFESKFNFEIPAGAYNMTSPGKLGDYYVIPNNGAVSLSWANFNEGDKILILGNVTELKEVNYNGTVTFYNVGTLTYSVSSGNRHTIINTGTLTINSYGNVGEVYNNGTLTLKANQYSWNGKADIPDAMSIFSTGEGSVLMPDGGDFKAAADIHGTLVADADTKIQNSKTQYICGVKVDGVLDMTQGHLQVSNIEASEIIFDGAEIWLTPGGHIKTDVIRMPNSATAIYGEGTSSGLIEVKDIYFQNTNNFDDSFSTNIYFNVTGAIDFSNSTKFGGGAKHYANVEAYNNENTTLKGYNEADNATGSPTCGQPWSVGKSDEYKFLCRVFCEDLSADTGTDFDFNDVVFDVYTNGTDAKVKLLAAGGTLPLTVADYEVHEQFSVDTNVMVNTGAGPSIAEKELPQPIPNVSKVEDVNEKIIVRVQKNGEWMTIAANRGEPAAKFAVKKQIDWQVEYTDIRNMYPRFADWVQNAELIWWE